MLETMEWLIYRNAKQIIALSPGIKKGIHDRYGNAPVHMIPNMSDTRFFECESAGPSEKKQLTIGYFGTFGLANHVESVLEIAKACQHENLDIHFILAGSGAKRSDIEISAHENSIENITFYPRLNRFDLRNLMSKVDAVLISFLDIPILETTSPNKFFDGIAAGKLIILNYKGWLKELVEENECGFYYDQNKPEMFVSKIFPFLNDKEKLQRCAQNARSLAERKFSKDQLVGQVCDTIKNS